jgi:transcriptional regulator with XRE-family HTH domain
MTETLDQDTDRRRRLAQFLRTRRERLTPADADLDVGSSRRRTPGLRREEVANLSGLSPTWYVWLEQGRDVSASPKALARLAEALRLAPAERAYLFDLAGKRDPAGPTRQEKPPPADLLAMLQAISEPAYLLDRIWNACGWNRAAAELFTGWLGAAEPNLLRYVFLDPAAQAFIVGWGGRARRLVAEFRADTARRAEDADIARLVDDLRRQSPAFARFWADQTVLAREGGERIFHHPMDAELKYRQLTLQPVGAPEHKLVVLLEAIPAAATHGN